MCALPISVRRLDVRALPVRAAARRHEHDLSVRRRAARRQQLRRAAVHAGAGFDDVPRPAGIDDGSVETESGLDRAARRYGPGHRASRLHVLRQYQGRRRVPGRALRGVPEIRPRAVRRLRLVRAAARSGRPRPPSHQAVTRAAENGGAFRSLRALRLNVYTLDPLADPRWPDFIRHHPDASIFHTPEWLDALRRTYGYEPVAYTTTPPARPLTNAVVVCDVRSWVTGRRLVSIPFADHCQPMIDTPAAGDAIVAELQRLVDRGGRKYVELRPMRGDAPVASRPGDFGPASTFYVHALDLTRPLDEIFRAFHKTAIQQMIRRAG